MRHDQSCAAAAMAIAATAIATSGSLDSRSAIGARCQHTATKPAGLGPGVRAKRRLMGRTRESDGLGVPSQATSAMEYAKR